MLAATPPIWEVEMTGRGDHYYAFRPGTRVRAAVIVAVIGAGSAVGLAAQSPAAQRESAGHGLNAHHTALPAPIRPAPLGEIPPEPPRIPPPTMRAIPPPIEAPPPPQSAPAPQQVGPPAVEAPPPQEAPLPPAPPPRGHIQLAP